MELWIYETPTGDRPFEKWFQNLRSIHAKARIADTMDKIESGLLSDHKSVGRGVHEIRIHFESGYRLYFGRAGDKIIILLIGSDKSTQEKTIKQAQEYWKDYKNRKEK